MASEKRAEVMKRFFTIRIALMCILAVWMVNSSRAQLVYHSVDSDYYPVERSRTLAKYNGGEIDEKNLFLYLVLTQKNKPYLYKEFLETKDEELKAADNKALKEYIEDIVYMRLLVEGSNEAQGELKKEKAKHLRLQVHPFYDYIWVHHYLKSQVNVLDEDIKLYYQQYMSEFIHPEKVKIRTIFLNAPSDLSMPERKKVRDRLEAIRHDIMMGERFEEMAQKHSEAKNAPDGGLLQPFSRGTFYSDFESTAFALDPGEISTVQDSKDGFYIIQCLEKISEKEMSFEEAIPVIRKKLEEYQLKLRHQRELQKITDKYSVRIDTSNFEVRPDDLAVVKVKEFHVTKAEMLTFYPEIYKGLFFDSQYLMAKAMQAATYEVIAQFCEDNQLAEKSPMLANARSMGHLILNADNAEQEYLKPYMNITPADEKEYYSAHEAEFQQGTLYHLYQLWGEIKNPEQYTFAAQENLIKRLKQKVDDYIAEMKVRLANQKLDMLGALIEGDETSLEKTSEKVSTEAILASLTRLEDDTFAFNYKDAGHLNLDYLPAIKDLVAGLGPAEFSESYEAPNMVVWYYVENVIPGARIDFEKARAMVFLKLINDRKEKTLEALRDKTLKTANIEYEFLSQESSK